MVNYYYLCSECNNPVAQQDAHVIQKSLGAEVEDGEYIIFCNTCFQSVVKNPKEVLKKYTKKPKTRRTTTKQTNKRK